MINKLFQTNLLPIVDTPADDQHWGGVRVFPPRVVILHATGGTSSLQWLRSASPATNPVSVHRLIGKDGAIYKLVADDGTAWHAGFGLLGPVGPTAPINLNALSLGIELENLNDGFDLYPVEQLRACAQQILEWWGMYGFLPVLGHNTVDARKSDPAGFDWLVLWRQVWKEI